jgi:hypothetical protein
MEDVTLNEIRKAYTKMNEGETKGYKGTSAGGITPVKDTNSKAPTEVKHGVGAKVELK